MNCKETQLPTSLHPICVNLPNTPDSTRDSLSKENILVSACMHFTNNRGAINYDCYFTHAHPQSNTTTQAIATQVMSISTTETIRGQNDDVNDY